ncbi:MAG: hypothetical protein Q9172_007016 [Xanthocarpia lactea]
MAPSSINPECSSNRTIRSQNFSYTFTVDDCDCTVQCGMEEFFLFDKELTTFRKHLGFLKRYQELLSTQIESFESMAQRPTQDSNTSNLELLYQDLRKVRDKVDGLLGEFSDMQAEMLKAGFVWELVDLRAL